METILLLHGAIGSKDQLQPLKIILEHEFVVHTINCSGHGGEAFACEFSIPRFASEVARHIEENQLSTLHIFGYSMGGYVAMYLALTKPQLVKSITTLATKFYWDETTAAKEVKMLDPDIIETKLPGFAAQLQQRHHPNNWRKVLAETSGMLQSMGKENPLTGAAYGTIKTPALIMLGDRDKMVALDETLSVYKSLHNAQMAVLPGTPHPLEQVDMEQLAFQIRRFVAKNS